MVGTFCIEIRAGTERDTIDLGHRMNGISDGPGGMGVPLSKSLRETVEALLALRDLQHQLRFCREHHKQPHRPTRQGFLEYVISSRLSKDGHHNPQSQCPPLCSTDPQLLTELIGSYLYGLVFPEGCPITADWRVHLSPEGSDETRLQLDLRSCPDSIAHWPWEYLVLGRRLCQKRALFSRVHANRPESAWSFQCPQLPRAYMLVGMQAEKSQDPLLAAFGKLDATVDLRTPDRYDMGGLGQLLTNALHDGYDAIHIVTPNASTRTLSELAQHLKGVDVLPPHRRCPLVVLHGPYAGSSSKARSDLVHSLLSRGRVRAVIDMATGASVDEQADIMLRLYAHLKCTPSGTLSLDEALHRATFGTNVALPMHLPVLHWFGTTAHSRRVSGARAGWHSAKEVTLGQSRDS